MSPHTPARTGEVVGVRRAPRYGVFAALGAMLGIVAAMILSTVFDGTSEPSRYTEIEYTASQAFGFILLWCVPAGILVGMLVALLLDRTIGRRVRNTRVVHEVIDVVEHEAEHEVIDKARARHTHGA